MPIFEYKCERCNSIFEQFYSKKSKSDISCISCGNKDISRTDSVIFQPNKYFCPRERHYFKKTTVGILITAILFTVFSSGCIRKKTLPEKSDDYTGIELTYYKLFDDSEVLEPIIKKYQDTHPGLKIHYKKFSDLTEYQNTILNEMAEGEGPDIFSMPNSWFISNYKKIYPMPSRMGKISDFETVFAATAYKDLIRKDDTGIDQIYALPMTVDTLALYYNKGHFEDNIPSRGKPSSTWEGIKEDVVLLNKSGAAADRFDVAGIAMGRADNISNAVDILYLLFLQYGVKFYNENMSEATFAAHLGGEYSYPGLEALNLYTSFADNSKKNYSWNEYAADDDSEGKDMEAFAKGQVSMILGYSYNYGQILNYINVLKSRGISTIDKNDIRIAPIPQLYDPQVSKEKRVAYANYFAETVSRTSKNAELAWDFLLFLTLRENLKQYFETTHKPTSRRDMIEEQKSDPIYGVFASQIGYAESFPILDYFAFKSLFSNIITSANLSGSSNTNLIKAQDMIKELLPKDGLLPEIKKAVE